MRKNPRPIKLDYMRPVHFVERFTEFMIALMEEAKGTPYWNMQFDDILLEYEMNSDDWMDEETDEDDSEYPRIKLIDVLEEKTIFFHYGGGVVDAFGNRFNFYQIPIEFEILPTRTTETSANLNRFKSILGGGYWSVYRLKEDNDRLKAQRKKLSKLSRIAPSVIIKGIRKEIERLELKEIQNGFVVLRQRLLGTPELMYNILIKYKAEFTARNTSTLVHELTHVRDVTNDRGYVQPEEDFTKYANHPIEVIAFIQEAIFRLWYDLIYVNPWKWDEELKPVYHRWNLENVFEHYLDETNPFRPSRYRHLTKQNKNRILSAMVQFLRENGFDMPPRRLYTDADFEDDSEE